MNDIWTKVVNSDYYMLRLQERISLTYRSVQTTRTLAPCYRFPKCSSLARTHLDCKGSA